MNGLAKRLVGAWRLGSYEMHHPDGGVEAPFGGAVSGMLIYDAGGFMSGQVMRPGRAAASSEGYIAYCGVWRVDEERSEVIHSVEASLLPKWLGTEQRRQVRFSSEDELVLSAPVVKDNRPCTAVLRWRRASASD